jgi:hypothetical protein
VSLLALALWASLAAAEPPPSAAAAAAASERELPPLRVEVLEGRAELASAEGVDSLIGPGADRDHEGPGYVRSSVLSRLSLRWRGAATIELEGAASLEWRTSERSRGLSIELEHVDRANLEVRRGPLRLALPGGWLAHLDQGAAFVRQLPDGSVELEHAAGAPILLSRIAPHGDASNGIRPPWTVLPGARIRLDAEGDAPRTLNGARARVLEIWARSEAEVRELEPRREPWNGFAWPWDAAVAPIGPLEQARPGPLAGASSRSRHAPWGPGWGPR